MSTNSGNICRWVRYTTLSIILCLSVSFSVKKYEMSMYTHLLHFVIHIQTYIHAYTHKNECLHVN